jgi:multidrug efflux pump subunit AcrB
MLMRPVIELFSRHRNAANLLFFSMFMLGFFGLQQLNTQFFPTVEMKAVNIVVPWPGATAQDIDKNIVATIEPEVRFLDGVKEVNSTSRLGVASITVRYYPTTDMQRAVGDVEAAVNGIVTLPKDIERPVISQASFFEPVASVLVSGPYDERALRSYAKRIRDGLLDAGVDKVIFEGLRDGEIWVETEASQLRRYDITNGQIAGKVAGSSLDVPGGVIRGKVERQVRAVGLAMDVDDVADIKLRANADGRALTIGDVARVQDTFDANQPTLWTGENRAIRLILSRSKSSDSLQITARTRAFLEETRPTLPPTLQVELFEVAADQLRARINVLLFNGLGGMVLVLCILFLFLNGRIAFWVAAGIPASIMATFGLMWAMGLSINVLSTFALIMTIGIIVDDAIVVGEHSATLSENGLSPQAAAEGGAIGMTTPVFSAALTTLAAFMPLLTLTDEFGQITRPIPLVLFAVLVASLAECFLVLPGHMNHALSGMKKLSGDAPPSSNPLVRFKAGFLDRFTRFREGRFRRFVTLAYDRRYTTLAAGLAILLISIGLIAGGRVSFRFFPSPEGEVIKGYVFFQPGVSREQTRNGIRLVERALRETEQELLADADSAEANGGQLINLIYNKVGGTDDGVGDERGLVYAQLTPSEERTIRTSKIMKAWEEKIPDIADLRFVFIAEMRGGPPGRDIDIRLQGEDALILKKAALEVRDALREYGGVNRAFDNLYYNKQELLIKVNARGAALGFTNEIVGAAARSDLQGNIAKRFARGDEEITIRVLGTRDGLRPRQLEDIDLPVPGTVPPRYIALTEIVDIVEQPGFAMVRRYDGKVSVAITADYDDSAGDPNEVISAMQRDVLPDILSKYQLTSGIGGRARDQQETMSNLRTGAIIGLSLIYVILAFVFASYSRPLIIMSVIPFGFVGTTVGHFVQGFDLTFLSMVGLLGLSGILVNNSIILISRIEQRMDEGEEMRDAVINGICDRLRAVTLTSLTTVLGLAPLLFETSTQAQFLLPMVITISWGLAFASLIVLLLVPSVLGVQEDLRARFGGTRRPRHQDPLAQEATAGE